METTFKPGFIYRINDTTEAHIYGTFFHSPGMGEKMFGLRVQRWEGIEKPAVDQVYWDLDGIWTRNGTVYEPERWDIASAEPIGVIPGWGIAVREANADEIAAKVVERLKAEQVAA